MGIVVACVIVILILGISLQFLLAPWRAARTGLNNISLLGGMVSFVTWTSDEELVLHRNARVRAVPGVKGEGGSFFLYPLLGDRIHARFDMKLQSFVYKEDILTREALPCKIDIAVWWKISDLKLFMASSGNATHLDQETSKVAYLTVAESRLKTLTDSITRAKIAQAAFLEVLTTEKPKYLDVHHTGQTPPSGLAQLSKNLETELASALSTEAGKYGITIDRVEIQGIRFPSEIEKELRDLWLSYLKPARAAQEAEADLIAGNKKLDLLTREIDLLGSAAISTREIVKHLPDNSSLTLDELLKAAISAVRGTAKPNDRTIHSSIAPVEPTKMLPDKTGEG